MSVVADILRSYIAPSEVVERRLDRATEASALATMILAAVLIFVAQWPRIARQAALDDAVPFDAQIGGALLSIVFMLPLAAYLLAALLYGFLRLSGRSVTGIDVRFALFWAFLAASPVWLVHGFLSGFLGDANIVSGVGLAVLTAFVGIFVGGLRAVLRHGRAAA